MKKAFSVRLDPEDMAKLEVLRHGGSREQWVRNMIRASAQRQEPILEAAINGFLQAGRAAVDDDDQGQAADYRRLITEYTADLDTLRRRGE